jgi:adenylate kinase
MRLVLVGPPGSGKGTQAERLVRHFNLTAIGTGAMFRDAIERGTEMGKRVKQTIEQGLLVDDPTVNDVVAELFKSPARPDCFVMDGYPRTYSQAIAFDALLRQQFLALDAVVNLTIPDDEVVKRIGGRRCCSSPTCGVCYHVSARPPKVPGKCDVCGSPLVVREDDKEETIRRRLGQFYENTDALLEHYRKQGLVRDISALDPPDVIFQNILKALGNPPKDK